MTYQTGKVVDIWSDNEPMNNDEVRGIETDATDVTMSPFNLPCNCVWVKLGQTMPAFGQEVSWGPDHVWWTDGNGDKCRINKTGNSFNRNDPLH